MSLAIDRLGTPLGPTGFRAMARVATTGNITLSGYQTIDGVLIDERENVLVKNQTNPAENGLYTARSGNWVRAPILAADEQWQGPILIGVEVGTVSRSKIYGFYPTGSIDLGSTPINFVVQEFAQDPDTNSIPSVSVAELKALDTNTKKVANLNVAGREGLFSWREGNYATQVALDTREGIYIKANAVAAGVGAWVRDHRVPSNPMWFGAVGNGIADDRAALLAWILMGGEAIWPNGSYRITAGIDITNFSSLTPRNVRVVADFDEGTAITVAGGSGAIIERKTFGGPDGVIRVVWANRDWTKFRRAFNFTNVYNCMASVSWINATVGIEMRGDEVGTVHNDIYLRECFNAMLGVHASSASATGWSNSIRYHGGFFFGTSTPGMVAAGLYPSVASHIYVSEVPYDNNGNRFVDPSLEWIGPDFKLFRIGGIHNYIRPIYCEYDSPTAGTVATGSWAVDFGDGNEVDTSCVPYLTGFDDLDTANSRVDATGATRSWVKARTGYYDLGTDGVQAYVTSSSTRPAMRLRNKGSAAAQWLERDGNGVLQAIRVSGTTIGSISGSGTTTSYNTTSDERLKTFGLPSLAEGAAIRRLSAVLAPFTWNADGSKSYGLSAQTAREIIPEMVTPGRGKPGDSDFIPWSVDWSKAVPRLIAYAATLERRISALEARK